MDVSSVVLMLFCGRNMTMKIIVFIVCGMIIIDPADLILGEKM